MTSKLVKTWSALAAAAALLSLTGCANMGNGLSLDGVSQKLNTSYNQLMSSSGLASNATLGSGPLYTPLTGGNHLENLFANQDQQKANYGKLAWPRVALTYETYGEKLPCWTVQATVWTNAKTSHNETFKVCSDAPIVIKNLTGDSGQLQEAPLIDKLEKSRAIGVANTGAKRGTGPLPPAEPFLVEAGTSQGMGQPNVLHARMNAINARIAFIAGYVSPSQGSIMSGMDEFRDYRMWIAGFNLAGKQS